MEGYIERRGVIPEEYFRGVRRRDVVSGRGLVKIFQLYCPRPNRIVEFAVGDQRLIEVWDFHGRCLFGRYGYFDAGNGFLSGLFFCLGLRAGHNCTAEKQHRNGKQAAVSEFSTHWLPQIVGLSSLTLRMSIGETNRISVNEPIETGNGQQQYGMLI